MKILIVEDEPSLRELVVRSLEKERYVVETASDMDSAMEKVELYDYDCILLDIMLPDGNGLELLQHLKSQRKKMSSLYRPKILWKTRLTDWIWEQMIICPNHFIWPN